MSIEACQEKIRMQIRRELKLRDLTYQDLADHLQVSLGTVKRILTDDDVTVSRLLVILEYLDLDLQDFVAELDGKPLDGAETPTPEDLKYFEDHPDDFGYLNLLQAKMSPGQIAMHLGLEKSRTDYYLTRLEEQGLITLRPGRRIVHKYRHGLSISDNALSCRLRKSYFAELEHLCNSFDPERAGEDEAKMTTLGIQAMRLSKKSYQNLVDEVESIAKRFSQISQLEGATTADDPEALVQMVYVCLRGSHTRHLQAPGEFCPK